MPDWGGGVEGGGRGGAPDCEGGRRVGQNGGGGGSWVTGCQCQTWGPRERGKEARACSKDMIMMDSEDRKEMKRKNTEVRGRGLCPEV